MYYLPILGTSCPGRGGAGGKVCGSFYWRKDPRQGVGGFGVEQTAIVRDIQPLVSYVFSWDLPYRMDVDIIAHRRE
jgi:hypothetical protein